MILSTTHSLKIKKYEVLLALQKARIISERPICWSDKPYIEMGTEADSIVVNWNTPDKEIKDV